MFVRLERDVGIIDGVNGMHNNSRSVLAKRYNPKSTRWHERIGFQAASIHCYNVINAEGVH